MRTTVDIADDQYAQLKIRAATQQTSVKALISEAVGRMLTVEELPSPLKKRLLPTIGSKSSKPLKLSHDRVNELLLDLS